MTCSFVCLLCACGWVCVCSIAFAVSFQNNSNYIIDLYLSEKLLQFTVRMYDSNSAQMVKTSITFADDTNGYKLFYVAHSLFADVNPRRNGELRRTIATFQYDASLVVAHRDLHRQCARE